MDDKGVRVESFEDKEIVVSRAKKPDNCLLIIFGATGDLSRRKLFPSLYHLVLDKRLPENFAVVGLGRSEFSEDGFRNEIRKTTEQFSKKGIISC